MLKLVQQLQQLLQLDGEAFVAEMYRQVLGREVESVAVHHYLKMLDADASKLDIVVTVLRSREAKHLYSRMNGSEPILNDATMNARIKSLLRLEAVSFIQQLYNEWLDRDPEPAALRHSLDMLRSGWTRYNIMLGVLSSEECLQCIGYQNSLGELDEYIRFRPLQEKLLEEGALINSVPADANPLVRRVSILILTWNGVEYTKRCLDSLSYLQHNDMVDVIIFDNGSTDGTDAYLRSIPWIRYYAHGSNVGFPAGNNLGLLLCDPTSDIVLLNNDIVIDQFNWLELLQETAYLESNVGVVGCRLRGEDGKLQHAGTYIFPETCWGQQIGGEELDINQYGRVRDVQGVVFACAYLKRSMLQIIGNLDQAYFAYFEDTDYCLRALANGYRVVCDGRVTLTHSQNTSTKVNNVDFSQLFEIARTTFRAKWETYLNNQYHQSLNWHSIANVSSGYANSSRNLMIALEEQRVKIHYRYVYGPGTPQALMEPASTNDYRINMFNARREVHGAPEVVYGQGDVFFKNKGRYKIGYTMLEVNGLPRDWVEQCNRMNEVWVPSTFNANTFRESGVHVPIHVIPLGVDPNYFNPDITATRFSDKFTFLTVFEWGERKAPLELIQTFVEQFRYDDVLLVCKVTNTDPSVNIHKELRKLNIEHARCRIELLYNQHLSDYIVGSLYRAVDCFVLPTRGEGWGMPILEAMACGLPTIATNWSAQTDFLNEYTGYPIRVRGLIPAVAKCPYYNGFQWAEPDYDHMATLMRYVYENREAAKERSMKTAEQIIDTWSWRNSASKIVNRMSEIRS